MNRILKLRDGSSLDVLGLVTLGVLLAVIALATVLGTGLVSLYKAPPHGAKDHPSKEDALKQFASSTSYQVDQIKGRSFFYPPPRPDTQITTPVSPTYNGSALVAYVN